MEPIEPVEQAEITAPEPIQETPATPEPVQPPAVTQPPTMSDAELDAWAAQRMSARQAPSQPQPPSAEFPDDWDDYTIEEQSKFFLDQIKAQQAYTAQIVDQVRGETQQNSISMVAPMLEQTLVSRVAEKLPAEARAIAEELVRSAVGTNVAALPNILKDANTISLLADAALGRHYAKMEKDGRPRPGEKTPAYSGGAAGDAIAKINAIEKTWGVKFSEAERQDMIAKGELN